MATEYSYSISNFPESAVNVVVVGFAGAGSLPPEPPVQLLQPAEIVYYPGFTFERTDTTPGSVSDGLPSVGLPADDVDFYTGLRDVSAKIGVPEDFWYLIEGARTNILLRTEDLSHAEWVSSGTTTVTPGQSDPAGGSTAARAEAASGNHWVIQTRVGQPNGVPRTASQWVRQGPGPGTYQWLAAQPFQARGGVATAWMREARTATSTGTTWSHRFVEGQNLVSFGGVAAGARDAVVAFPQQEVGGWASSYIATAGSARTRGADDLRLIVPEWWTTDVFRIEAVPAFSSAELIAAGTSAYLLSVEDSPLNALDIYLFETFGDVYLQVDDAGVLVPFWGPLTWAAGDELAVEVDPIAGEVSFFINGVQQGTAQAFDTSAFVPGLRVDVGKFTAGTLNFYGLLRILDIPPEWMPQDPQTLEGYTFTRASTATDGLPSVGLPADDVDSYGSNVLRKVSQSGKVGAASDCWLLLEGARTNFIRESAGDLTAAPWSNVNAPTVTAGQSDPMGGTSASRCEGPNINNCTVNQSLLSSIAATNVLSVWVRGGDGVRLAQIATANPLAATGGLTPSTWERWTVAKTTGTASNQSPRVMTTSNHLADGGIAQGARDQIVWGAQIEEGRWASSYIPTSGSAATRLGDDLSIDLPERWTGGQLRVEFVPAYSSAERAGAAQNICLLREDDEAAVEVVISGSDMIPRLRTWDGVYDGNPLVWAAGDEVRFEIDWVGGFFSIFINDVYTDDFTFTGGWQ